MYKCSLSALDFEEKRDIFDIHKGSQIKITMLVKKILSLDKSYEDKKINDRSKENYTGLNVGCRPNDKR